MKRLAAIAVTAAACAVPARANQNWAAPTRGEVIQISAMEALLIADITTTIIALRRPRTTELNPILGEHPSTARVISAGAAGGIILASIWYALPPRQRWVVPVFAGFAEAVAVTGNVGVLLRW